MSVKLIANVLGLGESFKEGMGTKINVKEASKIIKDQQHLKKEAQLLERMKMIAQKGVLVGIPVKYNGRNENIQKGKMNNATLLYIHTKGSPKINLPARPLIEPALEANSDKIAEDLAQVSKAVLDGNTQQALRLMEVTGLDAVNMIMDWFENPANGWQPNTEATIKAKLRKTGKSLKKRKKLMEEYHAGSEDIDQVLVDSGQMRKSITYVIGDKVYTPPRKK